MRTRFKSILISLALILTGQGASAQAPQSNTSKEFVMSCTYGVLAGTLVGAAMLAFTDQPGENLSKVARGASLGLYTGILLGLYVVYGVSDTEEEPDLANGPSAHWRYKAPAVKWGVAPTFTGQGIDGASFAGQIISF